MSRRSQLFVGRLPLDSRERDIEALFERYGSLVRCDLKYASGTGMAYAFVDYEDKRDAEDAIKYENGRDLHGQTIVVEWARGPSSRPPMRSRTSAECYRCHRTGHWARDCPELERDRYKARRYSRSGSRSRRRRSRSMDKSKGKDKRRSSSKSRSRSPTPRKARRRSESARASRSISPKPRSKSPGRSKSRSPRRSASRSMSKGRSPNVRHARGKDSRSRSRSLEKKRMSRSSSPPDRAQDDVANGERDSKRRSRESSSSTRVSKSRSRSRSASYDKKEVARNSEPKERDWSKSP